jgi:hypothetical protein
MDLLNHLGLNNGSAFMEEERSQLCMQALSRLGLSVDEPALLPFKA